MAGNFRSMLFLFTFLITVNEIVSFPGHIPTLSLVPSNLNYFTHRINLIQPFHGIRKILFPEMNVPKQFRFKPHEGQYMDKQSPPLFVPNMTDKELNLNISKENENVTLNHINLNNNSNGSNILNKEIDKKWGLFFDQYFKNETLKSKTDSVNNAEIHTSPDTSVTKIYTKNTEEASELFTSTDTTDTTPYDYETTTEDDLLRNGVPPEVISSLLG